LDEPTTGLGTNEAALVINAVRQATDSMSLITVATIHQPSKRIFNTFDDVLFLTKGGKMTYMGESVTVLDHFGSLANSTAPEECNPSDFCLGVIDQLTPDDARAGFERTGLNKALLESIEKEIEKGMASAAPSILSKRPNSTLSEVFLLTKRHTIVQWRNPSYCFMRMASSIVMSLFLSILFYCDKSTLEGAVFSIGAIFFLVFVLVIPMQAAVVPLVEDRAVSSFILAGDCNISFHITELTSILILIIQVLYRETVSGCYSKLSYGVGQLLADQPFHAINTVLMFVCFYFIVGFKLESDEMGYFVLMLYLSNWVIQSLGQLYALATPNEEIANGLGGLSVMLSVILMGFLINYKMMPHAWKWA
jgi:ABC-type multidrug transport system permease subunit